MMRHRPPTRKTCLAPCRVPTRSCGRIEPMSSGMTTTSNHPCAKGGDRNGAIFTSTSTPLAVAARVTGLVFPSSVTSVAASPVSPTVAASWAMSWGVFGPIWRTRSPSLTPAIETRRSLSPLIFLNMGIEELGATFDDARGARLAFVSQGVSRAMI